MVKKKGRPKPIEESWCLRITALTPTYWLARNVLYGRDGQSDPFSESAAIEMRAEIIEPSRFKGRPVEFNVNGDRTVAQSMNDVFQRGLNPDGHVGNIYMRGKQSQIFCTVPYDTITFILAVLQTQPPRYISLSAEPLVRGSAGVRSLHFGSDYERELNPEDA